MIKYITLLLAIPLGYLCVKATQDEKQIYNKTKYFPTFIKILIALIAIFISQNQQITLTLIFLLMAVYTWHKT